MEDRDKVKLAQTDVKNPNLAFPFSTLFSPEGFIAMLLEGETDESVQNQVHEESSIKTDPSSNEMIVQPDNNQPQKNIRGLQRLKRRKRTLHKPCEDEGKGQSPMISDTDSKAEQSSTKRAHLNPTSTLCPENPGTVSPVTKNKPDCDRPPADRVFAIDHLSSQILGYLDVPDLLTCRLVAHHPWNSVATSLLQKKVTLHFHQNNLYISRWRIPKGKNLNNLTHLLNQPVISTPFLCNKFIFTHGGTSISDPTLQKFLTKCGSHIRELSLDFKPTFEFQTPDENEILPCVQKLLTTQTPNLHFLFLDIISKIAWKNNQNHHHRAQHRGATRWSSTLQTTDPEYQEIKKLVSVPTRCFKKQPRFCNSSLKILKLGCEEPSAKILELIFLLSPNLSEIILSDYDLQTQFLLQPRNRLHLLQAIEINENCDINFLEKIAASGNLKLREISINFKQSLFSSEVVAASINEELDKRCISAINQILINCSGSLEVIELIGVTFLKKLSFPGEMPIVTKLELGNAYNWPRPGQDLFPLGFNLSQTFPNLKIVGLKRFTDRDEFVNFLNSLNFEPVPSVRKLSVTSCYYESKKCENVRRIFKLFPNAPREVVEELKNDE